MKREQSVKKVKAVVHGASQKCFSRAAMSRVDRIHRVQDESIRLLRYDVDGVQRKPGKCCCVNGMVGIRKVLFSSDSDSEPTSTDIDGVQEQSKKPIFRQWRLVGGRARLR
jgi:hypothetical protein